MAERERRSVRLTEDEAWAFVADAHTGILTTLRRDGSPVALPVWFAVVDRRIYVSTRGKKLLRIRHDSRCSFLVESGERWAELKAVHVGCDGRVLEEIDHALSGRIGDELTRKYAAFRTATSAMPDATREAYAPASGAVVELTPHDRLLTWDNARLGID